MLITILLLGSQPVQTAQAVTITVITLDTLVDENDHNCSDGDCSLRDAIETATPGGTIDFSVSGVISLGGTDLIVNKNLTISGTGASSLSISSEDTSRVFSIESSTTVTISGLTITNGKIADGLDSSGGLTNVGTLTLNNCIISENESNYGGGIYNFHAMTLNNCIIAGNSTDKQGGGYHIPVWPPSFYLDTPGRSVGINPSLSALL